MRRNVSRRAWPLNKLRLEELVEEDIVDAHNESEQRTAFFAMIEDNLALPFQTEAFGVKVTVERVDMNAAEEIVAICRHGQRRQAIPVLDLPLPKSAPRGAEWIEAYLYWTRGR